MDTIPNHYHLTHLNQDLYLIPQKAIFWKNKGILIVSDLHFGKAGHFRKAGIAVPALVHDNDFEILDQLLDKYNPTSLILLGDLFHSELNNQWNDLSIWIKKNCDLPVHLVKGNHDILPKNLYEFENVIIHEDSQIIEPFIFTHKPIKLPIDADLYNISGHIHPAVTLQGKARQQIKLPCFYFGKKNGILPAFGKFTGTSLLKIYKEDLVYVITGKSVVCAPIQISL
ncbi:MAG: ligase-associated DNA damage response endonuclease PdeM [Bacteroidota bacterium]|nr:ligase-associated DNA damage response endonuclease PdeM [Bacteroidota bacterium]